MSDTSAPFYKNIFANAVLYSVDPVTWVVTDDTPLLDATKFDFESKVGKASFPKQFYVDPKPVPLPDATPEQTKWLLVISLWTADAPKDAPEAQPDRSTATNLQALAWRVDTGAADKGIHVDFMGAFGGATGDRVRVAFGAPTQATGADSADAVLVQANFTLLNTLLQTSQSPVTFAIQAQGSGTSGAHTGGDATGTGALALGVGFGLHYDTVVPPAPTFAVSLNAIITPGKQAADRFSAAKKKADDVAQALLDAAKSARDIEQAAATAAAAAATTAEASAQQIIEQLKLVVAGQKGHP